VLDDLIIANRAYADGDPPVGLPRPPARQLVVVTCMDARIDPLPALGLAPGDAHVVRNAGAAVTEDVLNSVEVSRSKLGTTTALLIGHTDCAAHGSDREVERAVLDGVRALRAAAPDGFEVHGLVYDVNTARLRAPA
jgi:carbonic anhydrase